MPRSFMTARERWTAVLAREKPDRLIMTYRATGEAHRKLLAHLGCRTNAELNERLHIDNLASLHPRYIGPPVDASSDLYGCTYREIDYPQGTYRECVGHPLESYRSVDEIDSAYTWPTTDWFDYSTIAESARAAADRGCRGGGWEPFLVYKYLRGEEQAFVDLIENPDIVDYAMGKMLDFACADTERILEEAGGAVLMSSAGEDLGSQAGLLYSPEHIRRFFLPLHKRLIDLMHQAGAMEMWHSDGAIYDILDDLAAIGVDVLDPIQWRCEGMDRARLKREYGERFVFHGGVDNQETLPFGSADDVRKEVRYNIDVLGAGGGYILGPCHNIQSVGPPENTVAMYVAGYEYGWFGEGG